MGLQTVQGYNLAPNTAGAISSGYNAGIGMQQSNQNLELGEQRLALGNQKAEMLQQALKKQAMQGAAHAVIKSINLPDDASRVEYWTDRVADLKSQNKNSTDSEQILQLYSTGQADKANALQQGFAKTAIQTGLVDAPSITRITAANEKDRQFKQLMAMPDVTPTEKKAKKQYAQLIGAKGRQADLEEKIDIQKGVGEIKVEQDIKKAQELARIKEEHDISTAKKKSQAQKLSGYIESGVESADNLISANRSLELLNSVATGGYDAAALKAKQLMGIESGDEAELSYELGKSVLKQLKPTFGAAFTVNEMLELKRMEAGLGKSVAGNKRILAKLVKTLERAANRGLRAAKDQGDTFNYGEIERALGISGSAPDDKTELTDEDLLKKYGG